MLIVSDAHLCLNMAGRTRNQSGNDIIGPSAPLPQSDLPTLRNVLAYGFFLKENSIERKSDISDRSLAQQVCVDLKEVWARVNRKIVAPGVIMLDQNIENKVLTNWKTMKIVNKKAMKRSEEWKQKLDRAFNILVCHCPFMDCSEFGCKGCSDSIHLSCSCPAKSKVPMMEVPFLHNQLTKVGTKSDLSIGLVDKVESVKQVKAWVNVKKKVAAEAKAEKKKKNIEDEFSKSVADYENNFEYVDENNDENNDDKEDDAFRSVATEMLFKKTNQNRIKLSNMARVSLSCDVSIGATAQIGTALLIDLGIVTKEDTSKIIDKSKIRRERDKIINDLHQKGQKSLQDQTLKSIIFDGKKDATKVLLENDEEEQFPSVQEEDHYTIVDGIDGSYLTHLVPDNGTGKSIAEAIYNWLLEIGQEGNILVIGGDSTAVNTGWMLGAIHYLEVFLGHKVLWVICQLHINELGWRHLFEDLDGPTSSGNTFTGPIGKMLTDDVQDFINNPNFKRVEVEEGVHELSEDVVKDLSNDQKHGWNLVMLITGRSQDLTCLKLKPGPVCHSRWLTSANRLMIIYCKKHGLRGKKLTILTILVTFTVSHYYKMWFEIKCAPRLTNGPRHLLKSVQLLADASPEVKEIVMPVVQRGAYHGHSENILLTLVSSCSEEERCFAVDKIVDLRGGDEFGNRSVRDFRTPTLNWTASSLFDLIDWSEATSEPILTCNLSTTELMSLKEVPLAVDKFAGHGQSVERAVKETSNASGKVFGFERRDGYIRAKVKSRKLVSRPQSKKDLVGMLAF